MPKRVSRYVYGITATSLQYINEMFYVVALTGCTKPCQNWLIQRFLRQFFAVSLLTSRLGGADGGEKKNQTLLPMINTRTALLLLQRLACLNFANLAHFTLDLGLDF